MHDPGRFLTGVKSALRVRAAIRRQRAALLQPAVQATVDVAVDILKVGGKLVPSENLFLKQW